MSSSHVVLGAGPVGRAVVTALASRGIEPTVITRSGTGVPGARGHAADLTDPAQAADAVTGASAVFQCAQPEYHRWPEEFPALQARIVEAVATSAPDAVLAVAENLYGYGPVTGPLTEDLPLVATTRKGAVRAAMTRALQEAQEAGRLRFVTGRASDFFGPGVEGSAVGNRFFGPLAAGKPFDVVGDPDRLHTYTYVGDFGEALVRLAETPAAWGRAWHVPNAPTMSTRRFAEQAAAIAGTTARPRVRARWQLRLVGLAVPPIREMVEMLYEFEEDFVVDHTTYAALLGDHHTPLADSLAATLAAVRA
jgi:nucleoside-diphosphate-sugar epimerase